MNEDMLALDVMDDDGYGCAITTALTRPLPPWQPASNGPDRTGRIITREGA